jgi:hypothetical protein
MVQPWLAARAISYSTPPAPPAGPGRRPRGRRPGPASRPARRPGRRRRKPGGVVTRPASNRQPISSPRLQGATTSPTKVPAPSSTCCQSSSSASAKWGQAREAAPARRAPRRAGNARRLAGEGTARRLAGEGTAWWRPTGRRSWRRPRCRRCPCSARPWDRRTAGGCGAPTSRRAARHSRPPALPAPRTEAVTACGGTPRSTQSTSGASRSNWSAAGPPLQWFMPGTGK